MDILKKVFSQTSWQLLGKIITTLSTIVILRLMVTTYGETGVGAYTLALTYLSFFTLMIDFGLNAHFVPLLQGENRNLIWRKLLGIRLTLSIILLVIAVIILFLLPNQTDLFRNLVLVAIVASFLETAIFVTNNAIFQVKQRFDLSTLSLILGTICSFGFIIWAASSRLPLTEVFLGYVIGWSLLAVVSLWQVKRFVSKLTPLFDFGFMKSILIKVWPIALTLGLNVIYFRADSFILSAVKGLEVVGVYNLAYSVFQNALVIPAFIMNSFYPIMTEKFNHSRKEFLNLVFKAIVIMLAFSFVGILTTYLLSPAIVNILTDGLGFSGSVQVLNILAWGFPAFFMSSILMWMMVTLGKYKSLVVVYSLGLIFNLVANFYFIPQYSFYAAATITGLSEYLILTLQMIILYKEFRQ